jgi:hypothetical protein
MRKRIYFKPEIVLIQLDNQISLALQSLPPIGPDEAAVITDKCKDDVLKFWV